MDKTLIDISNEDIEKGLSLLLKNDPLSVSKFSVRYAFGNLLERNGVKLSKGDLRNIHVGNDKENEYIQRINQVMNDKGYILSKDSYDKEDFR